MGARASSFPGTTQPGKGCHRLSLVALAVKPTGLAGR
jgi:hypothetical protein